MPRPWFGLPLLLLSFTPKPSAAQVGADTVHYRASGLPVCRSMNTADLIECESAIGREADENLNRTFQRLLQVIRTRSADVLGPGVDSVAVARLRAAQRAWVAFRDAECVLVGALNGGSASVMASSGCFRQLTEARTRQLQEHARGLENP